MHVMAMPQGWRRLALADLPRERWRNGAGWTRPVASADVDGETLWRVSLAEISQAAPFSRFEGLDRTAVLAAGGPVHLHSPDQHWALTQPGDVAHFAGEAALHNEAPEQEALFWNVMARRDRVQARVLVMQDVMSPFALPTHGECLVWVLQGGLVVHNAAGLAVTSLDAHDGLHGHPGAAGITLVPTSSQVKLVLTQFV